MPFSSCVAHSSQEFYQRAKLLIGHNNGLCCTLLGFICGNECSLDVSEDFQDKALHVDVLLQYCSKFGSSKSKDFDLCCYPLRELGLILLQSESFLGLISCIIAPAVVFVAKFPRDFHLDFSIFTFLLGMFAVHRMDNIDIILSKTCLYKPSPSPIIQSLLIFFYILYILQSVFKPQTNQLLFSTFYFFHQFLVVLFFTQNLHFLTSC